MRICFISHQSQLEGAERSLLELIEGLQAKGVWSGVAVLKPPGPLMHELERLGVPWKSIPCPWWTKSHGRPSFPSAPIYRQILSAAAEVADLSQQWSADILYSNTSVIGAGALAAVISGKPHIWHIREAVEQTESYNYLMSQSELKSFVDATSSHVIFNSRAVQTAWTGIRLSDIRSSVVYNSVSTPPEVTTAETDMKVDVIIPMHNDPFILRCLDSLKKNRSESMGIVYVLDDMSSDQGLIAKVRKFAESSAGRVKYLRNREHTGFTGTCNEGMRLSENDIVLLNSDTIVTKDWVEKLRNSAHTDDSIGTVTPMSNNASLVSLPELYTNNDDENPEQTAELLNRIAPHDNVNIPTSHGFCVYIKRSTIQKAGVFDRETFGHGYGEENDYSMRLLDLGLRNVASCRAYVYHKGAQSFGQKKREEQIAKNMEIVHDRHPQYRQLLKEFREADPFHDLRQPMRVLKSNPGLISTFKFALPGTVTRWKRQLDAIKAVNLLCKEGREVSLWIFGPVKDNSYQDEINRYISEQRLIDRVHYIGQLDSTAGMLAFCDATFVCSEFEPFGRVTLESMIAGTPVIGADGGGTAELIDHGVTGLLYKPSNTEHLAQQAGYLIDNPGLANEMGRNARARAESFNSEADTVNTVYEILKKSANTPVPSGGLGFILESVNSEQGNHSSRGEVFRRIFNRVKKLLSDG